VVSEDVVIDKHSSVQEKLGKMLTFCGTKIYVLMFGHARMASSCCNSFGTKAVFSWAKFENSATVALSFLFGN